jgi:hypothetical protein
MLRYNTNFGCCAILCARYTIPRPNFDRSVKLALNASGHANLVLCAVRRTRQPAAALGHIDIHPDTLLGLDLGDARCVLL